MFKWLRHQRIHIYVFFYLKARLITMSTSIVEIFMIILYNKKIMFKIYLYL